MPVLSAPQERTTLRGLTSLWINRGLMLTPEINPRRAAFVLGRIDEILSWEKSKEQEKNVRFVGLGEYLCEVHAMQYWRLDNLNSFDEFLACIIRESGTPNSFFENGTKMRRRAEFC